MFSLYKRPAGFPFAINLTLLDCCWLINGSPFTSCAFLALKDWEMTWHASLMRICLLYVFVHCIARCAIRSRFWRVLVFWRMKLVHSKNAMRSYLNMALRTSKHTGSRSNWDLDNKQLLVETMFLLHPVQVSYTFIQIKYYFLSCLKPLSKQGLVKNQFYVHFHFHTSVLEQPPQYRHSALSLKCSY